MDSNAVTGLIQSAEKRLIQREIQRAGGETLAHAPSTDLHSLREFVRKYWPTFKLPSIMSDEETSTTKVGRRTESDRPLPVVAEPVSTDGHESNARIWKLCPDSIALSNLLTRVTDRQAERRQLIETLLRTPTRTLPVTTREHVTQVRALLRDFPNFHAAIETIARGLALAARLEAPLRLPPILLQGPPGLGKTLFVKELAKALGFHLEMRSFAEMTAGFVLTGSSSTWSESQPGLIARMLISMANGRAPLLMIDELDKTRDNNYPPDRTLLGLLEPHTAAHFRDEYLDTELDVRPLSVLFTANRLEAIRPEIKSRLRIAEIAMPAQNQMPAVVRSVDRVLRLERPELARVFTPISESIVQTLRVVEPRRLRAVLEDAYSAVADRKEDCPGMLTLRKRDVEALINIDASGSGPSTPRRRQSSISRKLRVQDPSFLLDDPIRRGTLH